MVTKMKRYWARLRCVNVLLLRAFFVLSQVLQGTFTSVILRFNVIGFMDYIFLSWEFIWIEIKVFQWFDGFS